MNHYGSSKSIIGKIDIDHVTGESKIRAIFSKYHGHPTEQGVTLLRFYMDGEKVGALLDEGDLCILAGSVETSIFYHRDYGQSRDACFFSVDVKDWPLNMEEFFRFEWNRYAPDIQKNSPLYLHTPDGWYIAPIGDEKPTPLYWEVLAHGKASGEFESLEDAPYFHCTDPNYPNGCSPEWMKQRSQSIN